MHEFIRIHLQRLNEAFGLRLPYSPSYTGLRLIIQASTRLRWRPPFQHAVSIQRGRSLEARRERLHARPCAASHASDRSGAHMSALRQGRSHRARPSMVEEKSNEIPGQARTDRGARPEGLPVHPRRRTHPKKRLKRAIASGNHLLTQVKRQPAELAPEPRTRQPPAESRAERPSAGPKAEIDGKPGN